MSDGARIRGWETRISDNRLVASRLEKARVTGKCGAAELGKCGAACGVIGTLTCGGCAPSSPSWRALCARAKRRRAARTSSLKPSLAPQMLPPIESTGGCGFSFEILVESPPMRQPVRWICSRVGVDSTGDWLPPLACVSLDSRRRRERRRVCATHCVRPAAFRENPGSCNNGATALPCSLVPCSIWVADPILDFFLTAQLCRFQPEARRLFSNFSYPAVCHVVFF